MAVPLLYGLWTRKAASMILLLTTIQVDPVDYKINLRHLFTGKDTLGGKGSICVKYSDNFSLLL